MHEVKAGHIRQSKLIISFLNLECVPNQLSMQQYYILNMVSISYNKLCEYELSVTVSKHDFKGRSVN